MSSITIAQLRKLCLALPESHEVEAWGEPTFRVRNKIFAMYARANSHHGRGRSAVWVKAAPGDQQRWSPGAGMLLRPSLCRPERLGRNLA